ncbi:ABC transporter permease [Actinocorallia sp. A-T 12471]|uniref:ABC transporter permease n=1 Tax=Actinocorallia sp. A-T 12471 TaxID=3089813 RepID=UPI0029CE22AF|nr:ABC-2 family transporter protein [Actinocorallia sp. A-T 12471]MDX6740463.1 ABC-2 family transporter protein [Actinocorallia sp. A-T 12471]
MASARLAWTWALLAWTWTRAAAQYPVTMVTMIGGAAVSTSLDLVAIVILFTHMPVLGGLSAAQAGFLYGACQLSFTFSDVAVGSADRLGRHIRAGSLDTMLIRPVGPLVQLATEDFSPRKLGRLLPATTVLVWSILRLDLTPLDVLLTAVMVVNGAVLFGALWVLAASVQFVLVNGHEATKAVTWGGVFMAQHPMSLYGRDFMRALTFTIPLAFVNWQPSLYILGHPDPLGLPSFVRFLGPVVTAVLCLAAVLAWRAGLRRYTSTGS